MKNARFGFLMAAVLALAGLAATGVQAANIVIVNNDGAGEGFNDPTGVAPVGGNWGTTLGQQRLIAFTYAAETWGACLQSNVTITVRAQMDPLTCTPTSAILGSAGATTVHRDFAGALLPTTWYPQALANSLAGVDLSPAQPDINATFNSNLNGAAGCLGGTGWYYGLDKNPGSDIDFVTVVLHEIGHGLGFQTFVNQAGAKLGGFNDHYMIYLENHGAVPADYPSMSDAQRAAANIADPNLHWTGPLVTAQGAAILGGGISNGHVRMHGPNPYQPGSSVSHWSTALSPNELMEPSYTGANHDPSLAWTLMDEIGWNYLPKVTEGCDGAVVDMASPTGSSGNYPDDNQERGAYVTALKDFTLCSIGWEASLVPGETITARVYAATGNARGALLATGSTTVEFAGMRTHYVPISYTLQECKEYDITVQYQHTVDWPAWNENTMTQRPFDVAGVIRVRDGEYLGGAGNFLLPHYTLQGSATSPQHVSDLANAAVGNFADPSTNRGAFIKAARTISMCAVGFEANYGSATPRTLTANIYNAAGLVRGSLLASGTLETSATGIQFHNIPVNALLREGNDYEIEVIYPVPSQWRGYFEGVAPVPFTVDGAITVVNGTESGNPGNTVLPHLHALWDDGAGGQLLDLVGPWHNGTPAGANLSQDLVDYGMYVTATKNSELYSLGWFADVPPGQAIGANVYAATGTTRGALISSGTILSGAAGKRWHDIPVSASLVSGQDYDLEIDIGQVDAWDCWRDTGDGSGPPLPYNAYGILTVQNGEQGGSASNFCLIDIRIGACATTVTGVPGGPTATPKFTLKEAFPNPFSGTATLGFELDEAATVTVQVFDVAGRRVSDVMKSKSMPAGPGQMTIDATNLASGVYFVKMSTPSKSVTRKITIVR